MTPQKEHLDDVRIERGIADSESEYRRAFGDNPDGYELECEAGNIIEDEDYSPEPFPHN